MIYLIDYLDMLFLKAGWFSTEEEAQHWIDETDPERRPYYKVIPVDHGTNGVVSDRKYLHYAVQR